MDGDIRVTERALPMSNSIGHRERVAVPSIWAVAIERCQAALANRLVARILLVFLAYYVAGRLGQATTAIRSGNLGPVWPASGIALAALLAYGHRVWPGVMAGSFLVAFQSPVFAITALGQAAGATLAAVAGTFLIRLVPKFDPTLPRLRDALALIVAGAFASSTLSASIGMASLYATGFQNYSGLGPAWLIYWLGDATGVLLVTPLVFTLPTLFHIQSRRRVVELLALLALLTATCFLVFGDLPLVPIRLHVLSFAVLPFVMWAAIDFGIGGAALSVLLIATAATLLTAFGYGPFSTGTPFVNATLLDVLFTVLAVSGLALAAAITERERAEAEREQLIRAQTAMETRLHLAAIVESSHDAILSMTVHGIILSWNAAAQRIFGYTEAETVGQPINLLIPPALREECAKVLQRVRAGERVGAFETTPVTKSGRTANVSVTASPLRDAGGRVVGAAAIVRDVTESKRAEEALSTVSRRLIDAQEQERSRIARDLHDDIGQRLSLLAVNLTGLAKDGLGSPRLHTQTVELQRQAAGIAADVQILSHQLHSSRLSLLGIEAAMRHFCEEFADQQQVRIEFESRDLPDQLPPDVALCLFRILQESLHNAAKHSGVRKFEVQLRGTDGRVHLAVRDHGRGFDACAARTGGGIGLISMEERMKLVGGDLYIESQPQGGTTIHARVPFGPPPSAPAASAVEQA